MGVIRPGSRQQPVAGSALAGSALLVAGMGAGAALLVASAWARLGASAPPYPVVAVALLVAVLGRCLAALGRPEGGGDGEFAYVGLVLAIGLLVPFTAYRPKAAVDLGLACLCVWGLWWQVGQLWRGLAPLPPPPPPAEGEGISREALGAVRRDRPQPSIVEQVQGTVGGVFLALGGLAVLAAGLGGGRGRTPVLLAGIGMVAAVGCGLLLLAQGVRRWLGRRAEVDGAVIALDFVSQSAAFGFVAVVVCVMAAALLPAYPSLAGVGRADVGAVRALLPRTAGMAGGRALGGSHPTPGTTGPIRGPGGTGGAVLAFGSYLVLGVVAVLVVYAVGRLAIEWLRRGRDGGGRVALWEVLADLWVALWQALAALGDALWQWLPWWSGPRAAMGPRAVDHARAGGGQTARAKSGFFARWTDPRQRVRAAYRRVLAQAHNHGLVRPLWASPRRFGPALAQRASGHEPDVAALTRLYERARYSPHAIPVDEANQATTAASEVGRGLAASRQRSSQ